MRRRRAIADCTAGTGSTSLPTAPAFSSTPTWLANNSTPSAAPRRAHPLTWPRWWESQLLVPEYGETPPPPPSCPTQLRRFHGSVRLDSTRVGRDAGRIADEVIAHLAGQMGAEVTVTIEIDAAAPQRRHRPLVGTVTENSRTLKFDSQGFEKE